MRLGTLLAERLLYAPSVGYCMLLSLGLYNTAQGLCALYSSLYSCDVSGVGKGKMEEKHRNKENEEEEESNGKRRRDTGDGIKEGVREGLHVPGTEVVRHCSDEGAGGRLDQATLDADQSSQCDSEAARMSLPGCVSHSHSDIDSDIDSASASASYSKSVLDIDRDGETDRIGYRNRDKETVQRAKYVYWVLIALITVTYSFMTVCASDSIQIKKKESTSTLEEFISHSIRGYHLMINCSGE